MNGFGWLKVLMKTAASFNDLRKLDQDSAAKLMTPRYRRFHNFLAEKQEHPAPYFGLTNPENLFPLLRSDQERIDYLRRYATDAKLDSRNTIIRYRNTAYDGCNDGEDYDKGKYHFQNRHTD